MILVPNRLKIGYSWLHAQLFWHPYLVAQLE